MLTSHYSPHSINLTPMQEEVTNVQIACYDFIHHIHYFKNLAF